MTPSQFRRLQPGDLVTLSRTGQSEFFLVAARFGEDVIFLGLQKPELPHSDRRVRMLDPKTQDNYEIKRLA